MLKRKLNKNDGGSRFLGSGFLFRFLLYIMPLCLFFSYEPVISLGGNESMNFELSVALIWLVVFDIVAVIVMARRKLLFKGMGKKWMWLLFPAWLSLSVVWSLNVTRGVLTAGILWLLCIAGYGMWQLRGLLDAEFRRKWWKWFLGTALFVCAWCFLQCVLDLVGVPREGTLICAGCTYSMFGFPHPDGFAIEPQFMGNLLLAPAIAVAWMIVEKDNKILERKRSRDGHFHNGSGGSAPKLAVSCSTRDRCKNDNGSRFLCPKILLFFLLSSTLFLTFSRGAIYAFVIGLVVMSAVAIYRSKGLAWDRKVGRVSMGVSRAKCFRAIGSTWLTVIVAFLFTLNVQGIMAAASPTNDTYQSGVAKVLNQLSLGLIDIRSEGQTKGDNEAVENHVENFEERNEAKAVFDGYVAESTDTRVRLTNAAFTVWRRDFRTAMLGVGLGGAGQALYNNGLSPAPKEIVQNEYASLLLETGVMGIALLIVTLILAVRLIWKNPARVMLVSLMVAYGITLMFFSGLPNALQIYLMPAVLLAIMASSRRTRQN